MHDTTSARWLRNGATTALLASALGLLLVQGASSGLWAEPGAKTDETASVKATSRAALEHFNGLIGGWRGVGQYKRGSSKDSWAETAEWVWDLKHDTAAIRQVKEGKLLLGATLTYDPPTKKYVLVAELPEKKSRKYTGTVEGNKLTLVSEKDDARMVHQIVITQLNEKRTLVLFQNRKAEQEQFLRVAEVGFTREGTMLAVDGSGEPECVVTGGKGTSSKVYKGKTYWFCCSGCRDAFDDDPEGVIADYEKKLAKRKAEKAK